MRRFFLITAVAVFLPVGLSAQTGPVSLGVGLGLVVPPPSADGARDLSFAWGFHVNIPIINTLHVTPSSEIYRIDSTYATDNALAFTFIVPLRRIDFSVGVVPGLTAAGDTVSPNVGVLGGVNVPVVSNIGSYLRYKYKVIFDDASNARFSHLGTGITFSF